MKTAFLTGVTGQDGAYLAKFLLEKGYRVVGLVPRRSTVDRWRLEYLGIADEVEYKDGDILDLASLTRALKTTKPDEVYHLAAQSFVGSSWEQPILTAQSTGMGFCTSWRRSARRIRQSKCTRPPPASCTG